jgi:hypothetical protein
MVFKIKDLDSFMNNVFGSETLLQYFPELNSTGVELIEDDGFHYIAIDGKPVSDTAFFSNYEMDFLEEVE